MNQTLIKRDACLRRLAAAGLAGSAGVVAADAALIAARIKFFGPENVDANTGAVKDKVVFSWPGHVTGIVTSSARVVMPRLPTSRVWKSAAGRTPFVIKRPCRFEAQGAVHRAWSWRPRRQRRVHCGEDRRDDLHDS